MAVTVIGSGEGFDTKGEVDKAALQAALKQKKHEVLIRNRFGREVYISEYHAKKMVARQECEIISEPRPLVKKSGKLPKQETIEDLHKKFEELNGRPVPNNKKNDTKWIKSNLGE